MNPIKKLNKNLHAAKQNKNDEFYTQLSDIEKELCHYRDHFEGKIVFCNCDDPSHSNFVRYFALYFDVLKLKKVISTHYEIDKPSYRLEITKQVANIEEIESLSKISLVQNGDFRSPESIELLKEADIVVTNPPFSLFREYLAQLIEYDKKFLVIGHQNAITYKEVFPLIKENKIWLGINNNQSFVFESPYENTLEDNKKFCKQKGYLGDKYIKVPGINWYTNLTHKKRNEELILFRKYYDNEESYPKYDNYDAIEVSKVVNIPKDYSGVMGVPITFLDKYNPKQFEIIWTTDRGGDGMLNDIKIPNTRIDAPVVRGKGLYKRILIRKFQNERKI